MVLPSPPHPSPLPRATPLARLTWDASIFHRIAPCEATNHAVPMPRVPPQRHPVARCTTELLGEALRDEGGSGGGGGGEGERGQLLEPRR